MRKSARLLVIGTSLVLLAAVAIYFIVPYAQTLPMAIRRQQLFDHPEPLPSYISAIAPFPGTKFPDTFYSFPYWYGQDGAALSQGDICVRFDMQMVLGNAIFDSSELEDNTPANQQYYQTLRESTNLSLNGRLFADTPEYALLIGQERELMSLFWAASKGPMPVPPGSSIKYADYADHVPLNVCWWADLPLGLYLAEFTLRMQSGETLRYQWAFEIADYRPGSQWRTPTPTRQR